MKSALTRPASEPISERDAAWFEELGDAVARGRAGLLARLRALPVRDTALSLTALADAGQPGDSPECERAARLLRQTEFLDAGEAAGVLIALRRSGHAVRAACGAAVFDGINRLLDVQNRDGGWAAIDRGIRRDPSCPAVTARVLEALGHFGFRTGQRLVSAAVRFVLSRQEEDGSWLASFGENGVRDTAQVLAGVDAVGFDVTAIVARRGVRWLKEAQNADAGWGADGNSDAPTTSAALLGLLVAGEVDSAEVRAGAEFLVGTQRADGSWPDASHSPLAALARYASATGVTLTRRDSGHAPPAPKSLASRVFADH